MPELTLTGAVDVVERQVRRVRRRKNLYELQRTLYLTLAAGAAAASVLLPLALFAPTRVFAAAATSLLVVLAGLAMLLAGALRRRWLGAGPAVAWIERYGARDGRMRTLLELRRSRASDAPGFFHMLLASQVGAALPSWAPRRLVPRAIPRAAAATAVVAVVLLAVVYRLAALGLPTPTGLADGGDPTRIGESSESGLDRAPAERSIAAPGVPSQAAGSAGRAASAGASDGDDDSSLTKLASALQENVRQQVWGKAWERIRDQLARSVGGGALAASDDGDARATEDGTGDDGDAELAQAGDGAPHRRSTRAEPTRDDAAERAANDASPSPSDATDDDAEAHDTGGGGAGNGTSPGDLFGGAPVATGARDGSFELSLAARMKSDHAGHRGGGAPAPDADPDARPALGPEQRREAAAHRMAVPAAYEQVVREVFAHREEP